MLAYLLKQRVRFVELENGVSTHPADWAGQAETPVTIQDCIDAIDTAQAEITAAEIALALKRQAARDLEKVHALVIETTEKKAMGFHAAHPEELQSYNITLRKDSEKKPVPSGVLVPEIRDDDDGIGFVLSTQVDPNADRYEWERGIAADPTDINTIPVMMLYKTTSKTFFVDDDVACGVRYFYRVRAINAAGEGAKSPAVSRVQ